MMIISGVTATFHVFLCWLFVFKIELGSKGAALANSTSYWINAVLLALYVKFPPLVQELSRGFPEKHSMIYPDPKLETSTLSISTRVSNELGAGNSQQARFAICVAAVNATSVGAIVAAATILVRHIIQQRNKSCPIFSQNHVVASIIGLFGWFSEGCGWQTLCAFINLGAYYAIGIPSAVVLAFVFHMGGMGLWIGVICGLSSQVVALTIVNLCTDWNKVKARDRVQLNYVL
ncbi:hypothetical protein ACS0TY_023280 [Phlomoides rotata]